MNKYFVKMVHVFSTLAEVEAEDKDGALEAAEQWFVDSSEKDAQLFYEATMDKKNWAVLTADEYYELREKIKKQLEEQEAGNNESNIIVPNA